MPWTDDVIKASIDYLAFDQFLRETRHEVDGRRSYVLRTIRGLRTVGDKAR